MVNVGGPSKGCLTCIQRKIRCDRQQPVCGQCQKSKRRCGGYRDATEIMFRNASQVMFTTGSAATQTETTMPEEPRRTQDFDSTMNASLTRSAIGTGSGTPIMIQSPKLNEESGLINFFANNFICGDSNKGSNLFWIPNNFDDLLKVECARFSVQSVGAMALARLHRSPYYHREAQKNYGLALLCLTEFWRQHVEVVKDAVLFTTLFLGFFEILASYDDSSRQSWTMHLGGLGHLMNTRKEQFQEDGFGAKMLLQSRSQAILNALQTKTPVADVYRNPAQGMQRSTFPTIVQSDSADMLLIRLATLQAEYRMSGTSDAMVGGLKALEDDICRWTENIPTSWSFSTGLPETSSEFWWEARYDVYPAAVIGHVWNKIRSAQIIIHDLVQEILSNQISQAENDANFALHQADDEFPIPKVRRLVGQICATIPVCYRPSTATAVAGTIASRPPLGTTYWLLWPLEVVGSMREAPPSLTEWIRRCLERIFEMTGIVKAQLGARRLKVRQDRAFAVS